MKTDKWLGFDFDKDGWSENHENHSDAFDKFARDFRSDVKTLLKGTDWKLHKLELKWFDGSGFLFNEKLNKFLYISISDVRYFSDSWNGMLIRTAKHDKDWTGGTNNYTSLKDLAITADRMKNWF